MLPGFRVFKTGALNHSATLPCLRSSKFSSFAWNKLRLCYRLLPNVVSALVYCGAKYPVNRRRGFALHIRHQMAVRFSRGVLTASLPPRSITCPRRRPVFDQDRHRMEEATVPYIRSFGRCLGRPGPPDWKNCQQSTPDRQTRHPLRQGSFGSFSHVCLYACCCLSRPGPV